MHPLAGSKICVIFWHLHLKVIEKLQFNVLASSQEEIHRELQRTSVHNHSAEHESLELLWDTQAGWISRVDGECRWSHHAVHLCHSVSHLCSQGQKGQSIVYSHF